MRYNNGNEREGWGGGGGRGRGGEVGGGRRERERELTESSNVLGSRVYFLQLWPLYDKAIGDRS